MVNAWKIEKKNEKKYKIEMGKQMNVHYILQKKSLPQVDPDQNEKSECNENRHMIVQDTLLAAKLRVT